MGGMEKKLENDSLPSMKQTNSVFALWGPPSRHKWGNTHHGCLEYPTEYSHPIRIFFLCHTYMQIWNLIAGGSLFHLTTCSMHVSLSPNCIFPATKQASASASAFSFGSPGNRMHPPVDDFYASLNHIRVWWTHLPCMSAFNQAGPSGFKMAFSRFHNGPLCTMCYVIMTYIRVFIYI